MTSLQRCFLDGADFFAGCVFLAGSTLLWALAGVFKEAFFAGTLFLGAGLAAGAGLSGTRRTALEGRGLAALALAGAAFTGTAFMGKVFFPATPVP